MQFKTRSKRDHYSVYPNSICLRSFDLELPLEVDDEYWEHPDPTMAFKQPPEIPPTIAYFNCFLKLNQILAFALRTIVGRLPPHHRNSLISRAVFNQQI